MWHRRTSARARRGCIAACAALGLALLFGSLFELRWSTGTNAWINIGYGAVGAGRIDAAQFDLRYPDTPWQTTPRGWSLRFTGVYLVEVWPMYERDPIRTSGWLPLWIPFMCAAIPTALLWRVELRVRRRARRGLCPACGYERHGLATDAACPECGSKP